LPAESRPTEVVPCSETDRGRESVGPPSLRTGQADFPHPALQLVVLPQRGLPDRHKDGDERQQSEVGEEDMGNMNSSPSRTKLTAVVTKQRHSAGHKGLACSDRLAWRALRTEKNVSMVGTRPHLPASLGSRPVTALPDYYGRSDSCSRHTQSSSPEQVSLITVLDLLTLLSPTTNVGLQHRFGSSISSLDLP
jgi:hypothetical protein